MIDGEADRHEDAMVCLAILISRPEALVVASMLEANGIPVCVGAQGHAGVSINSLALGGHRLWIPASHHAIASDLLDEVLGEEEWAFSYGLRRAVLRSMSLWAACNIVPGAIAVYAGILPAFALLALPLAAFTVPVNPQGRGDYFLTEPATPD
ncbi:MULTISPECIES: hypothetical protein [unclassified Novosphingobium]|uniref:hypothetical protein n=1 Tax=unclassified Novosphingobium TaxID=2644732 RepID=UPI00146C0FE0|nr:MULTISPECIES: hypothetical protein [unclassified Novosphingobium]NMN05771.1 hypothetical protein [Novosphingobium sp. SG919]NMN87869.1 hypothetical protein [Novosphingobium sp. SG916]